MSSTSLACSRVRAALESPVERQTPKMGHPLRDQNRVADISEPNLVWLRGGRQMMSASSTGRPPKSTSNGRPGSEKTDIRPIMRKFLTAIFSWIIWNFPNFGNFFRNPLTNWWHTSEKLRNEFLHKVWDATSGSVNTLEAVERHAQEWIKLGVRFGLGG